MKNMKIINIILIFMLIVMFLCGDLYALRVPMNGCKKVKDMPLRILMLDDTWADMEWTRAGLKKVYPDAMIRLAGGCEDAFKILQENPDIEIVVADFCLIGYWSGKKEDNGVTFCKDVFKKLDFTGKVIIYTSTPRLAVEELSSDSMLQEKYKDGQISILQKDLGYNVDRKLILLIEKTHSKSTGACL